MPFIDRLTRDTRVLGAALCVGVSAVHIDDQGGLTALADPDWIGWGYRVLEVAALVVAGLLVFSAGAGWSGVRARLTWLLAGLIALGPLVGYLLSRTTGLPGSTDDIGNWGEPTGVASLVIEGALIVVAITAVAYAGTRPVPANRATTALVTT